MSARPSYAIPDRSPGRPTVPQVLDLLGWYFAERDDVFDMGVADYLFAPNGHAQRRATIVRGKAMCRHYKELKTREGWHPDVVVAESLSAMTPTQRRKIAATIFGPRRPMKPERIVRAEERAILAQASFREQVAKVADFYSWRPKPRSLGLDALFPSARSEGIFQSTPSGDFPSFVGDGASVMLSDQRIAYGAFDSRAMYSLNDKYLAAVKGATKEAADFGDFILEHALPKASRRAKRRIDDAEREHVARVEAREKRGLVVEPQAFRPLGPQLHVCAMGSASPRDPGRHRPIVGTCGGKPRDGGLWTSTWMGAERGSNWVDYFLGDVYPGWMGVLTADGLGVEGCHLLVPREDAVVFHIDGPGDLDDLVRVYGARGGIDWRGVAEDFDAVHLTSRGKVTTRMRESTDEPSTWGWDAESTCWFRWAFRSSQALGTMYFNQARAYASRDENGDPEVF